MSEPSQSVTDAGMAGTWKWVSPDGEETSYLNILPFNEHEYYGEIWEPGKLDELVRMGIFSTRLNDVWFANIRCLGCDVDDGQYFFFRYDIVSEDELVAISINDDLYDALRELDSVDAVRSFISERMKEVDFFDDEEGHYIRQDDWIWPWETVE